MRRSAWLGFAMLIGASPLGAEQLCPGTETPLVDGRMLGHLPYAQAAETDLAAAPAGFAIGAPCRLRREVMADLARMLAAAENDPAVKGHIRAVSCFRAVAHQHSLFCGQIGPHKRARTVADRARWVAPGGYSEHATGYAIDFGTRPTRGCADVSPCFADTLAGRWLLLNAPAYGFELSFPNGNIQGVSWEAWHWRWVGADARTPGAAPARTLFARARFAFPASPAVLDNPLPALPGASPGTAPSPSPDGRR